jgi:hypothetical protein
MIKRTLYGGLLVLAAVLALLVISSRGNRYASPHSPLPVAAGPAATVAVPAREEAPVRTGRAEASPSDQGQGQQPGSYDGGRQEAEVVRIVDETMLAGPNPAMQKLDLHGIKTAIDSMNEGFLTNVYNEIPSDARIRLAPDMKTRLEGQFVEYNTDDTGDAVVEGEQTRIIDYGQFLATFSDPGVGDGSFLESIRFTTPQENYLPYAKEQGKGRSPEWVFKWQRNGIVEHVVEPNSPKRSLFPCLDAIVDKPLHKGDKFTRTVSAKPTTGFPVEVLGYLETKNHRCIVIQERVNSEIPVSHLGSQAANLPPVKSEITRTTYFDLDLRIPIRVDFREQRTYSPEHLRSPLVYTICGAHPPRNTGKTAKRSVFHIRL